MFSEVNELRRLTASERAVIVAALQLLEIQGERTTKTACAIMLQGNAEFVRDLFWAKP